jgi:hypothetical protein
MASARPSRVRAAPARLQAEQESMYAQASTPVSSAAASFTPAKATGASPRKRGKSKSPSPASSSKSSSAKKAKVQRTSKKQAAASKASEESEKDEEDGEDAEDEDDAEREASFKAATSDGYTPVVGIEHVQASREYRIMGTILTVVFWCLQVVSSQQEQIRLAHVPCLRPSALTDRRNSRCNRGCIHASRRSELQRYRDAHVEHQFQQRA